MQFPGIGELGESFLWEGADGELRKCISGSEWLIAEDI